MMTKISLNLAKFIFPMFTQNKIKAWHIHKKMTLNYVAKIVNLIFGNDLKKEKIIYNTFLKSKAFILYMQTIFISEYSFIIFLLRLYFFMPG